METMTIWTVQDLSTWKFFQRRETLRGQKRFVDPYMRRAYEWMRRQLLARIPSYGGGWPVWVWVRWDKRGKPDLRASGLLPSGTKGVRIELVVPSSQVLVSDFGLWHHVLNNWYCAWTEAEQEAWYQREDGGKVAPAILQAQKEKSWERCFDLTTPRDRDWLGDAGEVSLQGCIKAIHLNQVTDVTLFTAR